MKRASPSLTRLRLGRPTHSPGVHDGPSGRGAGRTEDADSIGTQMESRAGETPSDRRSPALNASARERAESQPARRPLKILMVLYFFPPVGGISTSRSVRNVQYLPRHGCTPVVLTPRDASFELRDEELLDLIPNDVDVVRTRSFEAGHVRRHIVRILPVTGPRRSRGSARISALPESHSGSGTQTAASTLGPRWGSARLGRFRRLLFFPDDEVGWLPFALLAALRRHRATPFDVVYSTASPVHRISSPGCSSGERVSRGSPSSGIRGWAALSVRRSRGSTGDFG